MTIADPKEYPTSVGTMYFWTTHPSYGREIWSIGGILKQLVEGEGKTLPATMELEQNYPNPFNPSSTITYAIPQEFAVRLTVYDMCGVEVKRLVDAVQAEGRYAVQFDAAMLPSGTFMYRLEVGGASIQRVHDIDEVTPSQREARMRCSRPPAVIGSSHHLSRCARTRVTPSRKASSGVNRLSTR